MFLVFLNVTKRMKMVVADTRQILTSFCCCLCWFSWLCECTTSGLQLVECSRAHAIEVTSFLTSCFAASHGERRRKEDEELIRLSTNRLYDAIFTIIMEYVAYGLFAK